MRILPWLQGEFKPFAPVGVPVRPTVERDRTSDGRGCSNAIGPGSFSLDHLVFGPGSSSLDHLDVSFEWDALDLFVDWHFAVFEHFLCTNGVRAAKPHTDAARTAVPKPGATTSSPNATAAPSASFFKRDGAGTSADASGSTEASPTVEANVSQLRGTVIALSQQVSA